MYDTSVDVIAAEGYFQASFTFGELAWVERCQGDIDIDRSIVGAFCLSV
jgi:hypothetical protein